LQKRGKLLQEGERLRKRFAHGVSSKGKAHGKKKGGKNASGLIPVFLRKQFARVSKRRKNIVRPVSWIQKKNNLGEGSSRGNLSTASSTPTVKPMAKKREAWGQQLPGQDLARNERLKKAVLLSIRAA